MPTDQTVEPEAFIVAAGITDGKLEPIDGLIEKWDKTRTVLTVSPDPETYEPANMGRLAQMASMVIDTYGNNVHVSTRGGTAHERKWFVRWNSSREFDAYRDTQPRWKVLDWAGKVTLIIGLLFVSITVGGFGWWIGMLIIAAVTVLMGGRYRIRMDPSEPVESRWQRWNLLGNVQAGLVTVGIVGGLALQIWEVTR